MSQVDFLIDGVRFRASEGAYLVDAARQNGVFIPTLCNVPGLHPRGSCRMCNVRVNGRLMTACTTPIQGGMEVENETEELIGARKMILELLFAEGNHFCPSCEKSGNCELQALAYRYEIAASRFPYRYPNRKVEANSPALLKDQNRCILCKRCIRGVKDEEGRSLFAYRKRGAAIEIILDRTAGDRLSPELAKKAVNICPVGALLPRNQAFRVPLGSRKYDHEPIGTHIFKEGRSRHE